MHDLAQSLLGEQLEVEKLIVNAWTSPPKTTAFNRCNLTMHTAGTLGGCCRITTGAATERTKDDVGRAAIVASMVRLAFHDAAPFSRLDNTGGPNGCVDFADRDNAGLEAIVQTMLALKAKLLMSSGITMSLADLYQYSALVAVWCSLPSLEKGGSKTVMDFPFKYGRTDAATCDHTKDTGRMPDSEKAYAEVHALANRWGMSMQHMSALMGAHALGTTKTANSGYSTPLPAGSGGGYGGAGVTGQWVNTNAALNGQTYYALLIKFIWKRQTSANGLRHSFVSDGTLITQTLMLNTDISILYNAGDDATITDGTMTCKPAGITNAALPAGRGFCGVISATNCPVPGTCSVTGKTSSSGRALTDLQQLIVAYSDGTAGTTVFDGASTVGQETWWPDFKAAFKVLAELGYSNLCFPGTACDPNTSNNSTLTVIPPTSRPVAAPPTAVPVPPVTTSAPRPGSPPAATTSCLGVSDSQATCASWASQGQCTGASSAWMLQNCARSCNPACSATTTVTT